MAVISRVEISALDPTKRIDAEYYQPVYLAEERLLGNTRRKQLRHYGDFITGPFGSEFNVENYAKDTIYRYVRGKDVKPFQIANDDNVYIPKNDYDRLNKHSLSSGDILISVVGTLGNAAIITDDCLPAIFSCKSTAFRSRNIDSYYLITYLNCKYGHNLLVRRTRGTVQTGLNIDDLRTLPIMEPARTHISLVSKKTREALRLFKDSFSTYTRAEHILFAELGLLHWKPTRHLTFVRDYRQVSGARRIDAEHFQPKYQEMFDRLSRSVRLEHLGRLTTYKKGIEVGGPAYTDSGVSFWRVSNLTKHGLDDGSVNFISDELYQSLRSEYEPKQGEILISKDATPGLAYYLEHPIQGIVSGGILRLSIVDRIRPHYLELALNSLFVQIQIEQDAGGSIIKHWKPSEVRKTWIPRLSDDKEGEIATLIQQSHAARREAKALLEKSKSAVELAIEEGEDKAIEYIG